MMFNYIKNKLYLAGIDLDDNSIRIIVKHVSQYSSITNRDVDEFINTCIDLTKAGEEDTLDKIGEII